MRIGCYIGDGVSDLAKRELPTALARHAPPETEVEPIDSSGIIHSNWSDKFNLLVIPGGRDLPYCAALNGAGNRRIKEFVQRGGNYLGLCAGAYYGSSYCDFDRGQELEVLGERELKFFPGSAVGPAYGLNTFSYESEAGARAVGIKWLGPVQSDYTVYYNGGCYFDLADKMPNVTVLATYSELGPNKTALVEVSVGLGKVILSGVHFEYSYRYFDSANEDSKVLMSLLMTAESKRVELFEIILKRLLPKK